MLDGSARKFTFKPDRSWHAGKYTLRVVAAEASGDASTRYERTAKRRRTVEAAGVVGYSLAVCAPAQQNLPVEQSADAQTQPAQGAAEQGVAEDAAKQEVGGDAPEQEVAEGVVEQEVVDEVAQDASEQIVVQDATSTTTTPVSRKTDPHSDTELRKDLGGSELPTPVRLSPHDIHTEITFVSEDEVDVQLSLAEGAPMEISVRALAAQLTGDDAVRIEILDLPEGLRFDRETGMLEDTLGSGLSADGVVEVRVMLVEVRAMLTDAQGRRMTVTLQVLSVEGLSQPEAVPKLEGRTQTDDRTGSGELGGGRRDVGGSSDAAGLSDEGEGSEGSDSVGDAALKELSGDKEARSSSGSAGSGSAGALSSEGFFANFFGKGGLRLRSLSDFFLDLFRGFSSEKEIVLGRDIPCQWRWRSFADTFSQQPGGASCGVGRTWASSFSRCLFARPGDCLVGRAFSTREASTLRGSAIA